MESWSLQRTREINKANRKHWFNLVNFINDKIMRIKFVFDVYSFVLMAEQADGFSIGRNSNSETCDAILCNVMQRHELWRSYFSILLKYHHPNHSRKFPHVLAFLWVVELLVDHGQAEWEPNFFNENFRKVCGKFPSTTYKHEIMSCNNALRCVCLFLQAIGWFMSFIQQPPVLKRW